MSLVHFIMPVQVDGLGLGGHRLTRIEFKGYTDSFLTMTRVVVSDGEEDWTREIHLNREDWDRLARLIHAALDE